MWTKIRIRIEKIFLISNNENWAKKNRCLFTQQQQKKHVRKKVEMENNYID